MKKSFLSFLHSCFVLLALVPAAVAENNATFTLFTPRYYIDNLQYYADPSFISGTRGSYTSFESSFSSQATYVCNSEMPAGYYVAKWVLYKAFTSTVVKSQEGGTSFTVVFDYKWAAKYGNQIDLVVYLEPITYTLSYDANGGSWTAGEPEGGEYKGNDEVTAPGADSVEKDNYTLTGWTTKGGGGSLIEPGETFTGTALGVTKRNQNIVLYAQWGVATYKVTMAVPNGATLKNSSAKKSSSDEDWDYYTTSYTYGEGMTLPTATKSGSTFVAWYDNPNFLGDKVSTVSKYEEGDVAYYAKFETKLAVHYDGNGASSGTMADQSFVSGETVSLARNAFKKTYTVKFNTNGGSGKYEDETADYTFSHWNTKKDGTGDSYEDGQSVTFDKNSAFSLYAQWEPATVSITLPAAPKWSGHSFSGWFTAQAGGSRVGYGGDQYVPTGNMTLYAQWDGKGDLSAAVGLTNAVLTTWCTKKSTYKGEDNLWQCADNGGYEESEGYPDPCLHLGDNTDAGATSILGMSVNGHGFVTFKAYAWKNQTLRFYDGKIEHETTVLAGSWMDFKFETPVGSGSVRVEWRVLSPNSAIDLDDIRWEPDKKGYTITAEPSTYAGGTVTGGGEYMTGDEATLRAQPKTGWKFVCWRKDGAKAVESTDNPYVVPVTTNATYTAVLADEWYYIAYNKNGGTGTMDKQLAVWNENTPLTANAFKRANYTFVGWNTAKDGSGKSYADGDTVRNLALSGSTATLYAQWKSGSDPEPGPEPEPPEPTPEPGPYASAVGEAVEVDLAADCEGYTIKSVSGLPTGLKYNKKTGLVTGTPTKAVSKENNVTITFTDKTKVKATWTVEPLPTMMVGTYYGAATVDGIAGQCQLKMAATGKATGYFYVAGKKVSFKSTALVCEGEDCYVVKVTYKYNGVSCNDTLLLMNIGSVEGVDLWTAAVDESEALDDVEATRDIFKETGTKVAAKTYNNIEDGSLEDGDALTAKVSAKGAVKVSGKAVDEDANPAAVACSTQLVYDEEGALYCWITIYKVVRGKNPIERCFQWYLPDED